VSGLLDNKTRVLDTIVTVEGRRQLSRGGIDIAYVSFTDQATFYKADVASGSQDATKRIYLESCQLPQDQITFQADDAGNVQPFGNADGIPQSPGKIVNYTYTGVTSSVVGGDIQTTAAARGLDFTRLADNLLGASADNFKKLMVLSTHDNVFEEEDFLAGPDVVSFTINDDRPIRYPSQYTAHVNSLDSIFSDVRFSRLPNFKYLPPVNKVTDASVDLTDHAATSQWQLAFYVPWGMTATDREFLSIDQILYELRYYESLGYMKQINFDPTSLKNTLVGQFFEKNFDTLKKLDVVDYGRLWLSTGNQPPVSYHVFFVGKLMVDDKGTDTFIHIFTLVFE
jgi:hypothetical protein